MPVDATGLRRKVRAVATEASRVASAEIEDELREEIRNLSVWDYTHARRAHFLPHLDLHGIEFSGPDDPLLYNPDPFPPTTHFHPGDHRGCLCRTRRSNRTLTRTAAGPSSWRIVSEPPKVAAARFGNRKVSIARTGRYPEWARDVLTRSNWIRRVDRAVRGRVSA